jgi:hypothetical protein
MYHILFVCDGAKPDRKFFNSMGKKEEMKHGVVYKTVNRYSRERYIYILHVGCSLPDKDDKELLVLLNVMMVPATCG